MPVTARLSRRFYDTFGDEIANEFVDWFNQVDAQYRSELRDLAETYYTRFHGDLTAQAAGFRGELSAQGAAIRGELASEMAGLRAEMAGLRADLLKWMFVYWAGTVLTMGGLVVALVGLLTRAHQ